MNRTNLIALLTALGLAGSVSLPVPDRMWQRELQEANLIYQQDGAQAARAYLLKLPATLPAGKHVTLAAEFGRLRQLTEIEFGLGLWGEADGQWEDCLRRYSGNRDAYHLAAIQVARFNVLYRLERLGEARFCLDQGWKYMAESDDRSLEPFILHDEGKLLVQAKHFEESIAPLDRSLALFERQHRMPQAANVRVTKAWSLYLMGRYEDAEEQYLAAQKSASPADQHLCLGHLGSIAAQRRDFKKAADYAHQASQIAETANRAYYATWLANEATSLIYLEDYGQAREQNEKALAAASGIADTDILDLALVNQARITGACGNSGLAIAQLQSVVHRAKQNAATLDAYAELAGFYLASGNRSGALAAYQSGLHLVTQQRNQLQDIENKFSFEASAIRLSRTYIEDLMERGDAPAAFEAAEASRAVMLHESLNLERPVTSAPQLESYRQAANHTGSAYLAYWIAPEHSYLWVVTAAGLRCYPLPGESELQTRVDQYQQLIQNHANSDSEGAQLFRTLVAPALPQIGRDKKIVVSPDGPLYGINLETLRQGSATAPYWIESATVAIAPSLSIMLDQSTAPTPDTGILSIGDAKEWDFNFPQLLNSSQELDNVEAHFPAEQRTRLAKENATAAEFRRQNLSGFRYIHFATHAAANRQAPLESAIILSKRNDAGMLTAREVLQNPVRAELVSISACRSAGGKTYAGEGLVGLAWAFLHSGAHFVVAGLWDVSDHSSPVLMDKFYAGLANGKAPAGALRQAKLELLRGGKYNDPYYWGPFMLYQGAGSK